MHTKYVYCYFIDVTIILQANVLMQSMDLSMIEVECIFIHKNGFSNLTYHVDMRSEGLKSLWVEQLQVVAQGNWTVRKLHIFSSDQHKVHFQR